VSSAYILSMTEEQLTQVVLELAKFYGWKVVHFRPARTRHGFVTAVQGDIGSPDVILARRGVVLMAELKTERGRLTPQQKHWAQEIGEQYRCWRPRDLDQIKKELAA
jgi:hypothetical protein